MFLINIRTAVCGLVNTKTINKMMKIKLKEDVGYLFKDFLNMGTRITTSNENVYYNLPFWITQGEGDGIWNIYHPDELPQDLSGVINRLQELKISED
jgi:hypothetical protein